MDTLLTLNVSGSVREAAVVVAEAEVVATQVVKADNFERRPGAPAWHERMGKA